MVLQSTGANCRLKSNRLFSFRFSGDIQFWHQNVDTIKGVVEEGDQFGNNSP